MGKEATQFKEGNPGKQKGTKSKTTTKAKELFYAIMDGEIGNIKDSLDKVRKKNPAAYLTTLSKLMPYFLPKKLEVDAPTEMIINVKRRG
jgi:hypothetical protein